MFEKLKAIREEREEAFTLIELLVVILIIGILAAIAIPVFLNQRQTANDGAVESDVRNAAVQLESWVGEQMGKNTPLPADVLTAKDVKVSSGVTLTAHGTANGYCILGAHANGKKYLPAQPATYDSAAGGLHQKGVTCLEGMRIEDGLPKTSAGATAPNGSGLEGEGATSGDTTNPEAGGGTPVEVPLIDGQKGITLVNNYDNNVTFPAKLLVEKTETGGTKWTVSKTEGKNFTGSVGAKTTSYTCADGYTRSAGQAGFQEMGIMLFLSEEATEESTSFTQNDFHSDNGSCDLTSVTTTGSTFMVDFGISGSNTFTF